MSSIFLKSKGFTAGLIALAIILLPYGGYAQAQSYSYQPRTQQELIAYLFGIVAQLQAQLSAQRATVYTSQPTYYTNTRASSNIYRERNPYFVNVVSLAPTSISRTEVTLQGEVDKGGSEELDVWFEYGTGGNLTRRSSTKTINYSGRQSVSLVVDDLRPNTYYHYRIAADDEDGNRHYGQIRSFETISSASSQSFYGRPTAETEGANSISSSGAYVEGFVSMNDYNKGYAFFVYGKDRSDVNDADDYDSYADIPVSGDVINKSWGDRNFTGRNTLKQSIYGLKNATTYYYRVCVEYNGDNPRLVCGQTENFTTLN